MADDAAARVEGKVSAMLRLIKGRSGSGKTTAVQTMLADKVQAGGERLMLLVPEQASFASERAMLNLLGERQVGKVEITSFKRLSDLVFRSVGGLAGRRLDEGGRRILMSLALEQVRDRLVLYRRGAESAELVNFMLTAYREFIMCRLSCSALLEAAERLEEGSLRQKLRETALILEAYEALVKRSFVEPMEELTRLSNVLETHPFFEGYTVFLDSFIGFTEQEWEVFAHILRQAEEVTLTLCADGYAQNQKSGLFAPVARTERRAIRIARENGIPVAAPVLLNEPYRFCSKELRGLEEGLFRSERHRYEGPVCDTVLFCAENPYEEADFTAREIRSLVMERGYRYRDILVLARTDEEYGGILRAALEKYRIPCFMDRREEIDAKPLMNLLLTAFSIVNEGWRSDAVFRYLKTGLAGISYEDIAELENYALLWSIDGKRWLEPFTAHPEGFAKEMCEEDECKLQRIETLRRMVVQPLRRFKMRMKTPTGKGLSEAAYRLLEELQADQQLRGLAGAFRQQGEEALADEQLRLWDILMLILDQTALVLGEHAISPERYAELLRLVINGSEIAYIPQGLDEVTFGCADRTRPEAPRAVFLLGVCEGEFPRTPVAAGVFSDAERRLLLAMGLPLHDALENLALEERFLAYRAVSAASERLYITWPAADAGGGAKTPSALVREVKRTLPQIVVQDAFLETPERNIWAERPAFEYMARHWRDCSSFSETLKRYFAGREDYRTRFKALSNAAESKPAVFSDPEQAVKLFGNRMRLSASQVEKFYLCRFQYFCRYGLGARERKPAAFDALEYGSLMHYILERFLAVHGKEELAALQKNKVHEEIQALLEQYLQERLGGWQDKTARFRALFYRVAFVAETLVSHIARELAQSEFVPQDYELSIAETGEIPPLTLALPGGGSVAVEGKVDRVDVMRRGGVAYVRVVDYKTGGKEFRLSDLLYGLNMQMVLYLAAIWKNGASRYGSVVPAGVLYMPAGYPAVNASRGEMPEKVEAERMKKLRMNGLILEDEEVVRGMERDAQGIFIPVKWKDGHAARTESVASLAQMGALCKRLERLVAGMAQALRRGEVQARPAGGEYDACAWCPYHPICGHERGDPEFPVRKWDKEAVLRELEAEQEIGGVR
jgi:ATP-dependent helicase/nuclease subunit B